MTGDRLSDLGATTRAMRADWHAEEAEITEAAYQHWRHGRSLPDVLAELAGRGDAVHLTLGTATIRGPVIEIGPDRFTIAVGSTPVDVSFGADVVIGVDSRAAGDGETPTAGTSMRARLLEHETAGNVIVLGTAVAEVRGTVVVGSDHVVVTEGDIERIVPLGAIAWVRAEAPD